eukprot:2027739-Rhodomonas_salina.3
MHPAFDHALAQTAEREALHLHLFLGDVRAVAVQELRADASLPTMDQHHLNEASISARAAVECGKLVGIPNACWKSTCAI